MSVVPQSIIADGERAAGKLPERGTGEGVVPNPTAVERRVGAPEVELGAGLGLYGPIKDGVGLCLSLELQCDLAQYTERDSADPAGGYRQH